MARTGAAYLRDSQALSQLSLALGKFASGVQEAIIQADAEIRRTQEWLQERAKYWHQQVVQARQEVEAAQHALHRCQSSVQYDRDGRPIRPDCSAEIAYLSACRRRLQQAEEELRTVKKWQARIGQAVSQYQNSAKRMRDVATTSTKKAQGFLSQKITEIEGYGSIRNFFGPTILATLTWTDTSPEVGAFGNSGVMGDDDVRDFLRDELPFEHISAEHLRKVEYTDEYKPGKRPGTYVAGTCHINEEDHTSYIDINRQTTDGSYNADIMKGTIAHEIGHNVYYNVISSEQRGAWNELSRNSGNDEYVSDYARTNIQEDFSETYKVYICDPEALREVSPEKYAFMRDRVFRGREY